MTMKISRTALALGAAGLLALAACGGGGSTTTETPEAPPTASEAAPADTTQGCDFTDNTGTSTNKKLQAFAVAQYESLDCSSATDLTEQLTTLIESPAFEQEVADLGWSSNTGDALGAISVAIIDIEKRTGCTISAIDSPSRGKTVDCQDV
jgi:hypothetical protein